MVQTSMKTHISIEMSHYIFCLETHKAKNYTQKALALLISSRLDTDLNLNKHKTYSLHLCHN